MGAVQPHRLMPRAAAHGSPLWRGGQGVHWSKPRAPPVRLRGEGDPRVDDRPREFKELMTVVSQNAVMRYIYRPQRSGRHGGARTQVPAGNGARQTAEPRTCTQG